MTFSSYHPQTYKKKLNLTNTYRKFCFISPPPNDPKQKKYTKNKFFFEKKFADNKILSIFAPANTNGAIAQLVEQRTENPCVPRSIRGGTTQLKENSQAVIAV